MRVAEKRYCYKDPHPAVTDDSVIFGYEGASKTENLTEEEAVAYSQSYLKELDNQSVLKFATRKSREEESERIVKNMLKEGLSIEMIATITELPEAKILSIRNSL